MDYTNFIANLNGDLAREYAAWVQYLNHGATLTGLHFAFVQELYDHAEDEGRHAKMLNEHIAYLGGIPLTNVAQVISSSSSESMLFQDKASEEDAIKRYSERIIEANSLGLVGTVALLYEILKDEEGHLNDIRSILAQ